QVQKLINTYLSTDICNKIYYITSILNDSFHNFIVGQCIEAVILGVLCVAGMLLFQFPYAVMIGILIGCTALVPIAGAYIGGAVGAVMIFTESPVKAVMFVVFLVILQQFEDQIIYPKVVGSSIGLPGIWVFAAVIVGGGLFGIPGTLFGIPIVSTIYKLISNDVRKKSAIKEQEKESKDEDK
ncbi:MAG: AI-2E family transporter, partial [Lachnospiraceae bacterium]|nr:AI-2E family transporter [Lachnospiraceae bacterium]